MGHMSSSRQFAIMSLHAGQKNDHEVCTIYLLHSAISSIDCGKGSICRMSNLRNGRTCHPIGFRCQLKGHSASIEAQPNPTDLNLLGSYLSGNAVITFSITNGNS